MIDVHILLFAVWYDAARTAVAISLGCIAINFLLENKIKKNITHFFSYDVSYFCNNTIYFINNKKIKINFIISIYFLFLSFSLEIFFNMQQIITVLLDNIGLDRIANRYISYSQSEKFGYTLKLYDPRLIFSIISYLLLGYKIKQIKINGVNKELLKIFFLEIFLWYYLVSTLLLF